MVESVSVVVMVVVLVVIESPVVPVVVVVVEMLVALNVGFEELMGGVTLLVNLDGMMIVEKALCCVVEVEVFLRVLLGTMEEAMTLVVIGAAMLVLAMAVMLSMPTTVALVAIVEVLSAVLPGIVLV